VITINLEGMNLIHEGISVTLSLSTIILLDLQSQKLKILIPLVNLTMRILLYLFQRDIISS